MSVRSDYTVSGMGVRLTYDAGTHVAFDGDRFTKGRPTWRLDGGYFAEQDWRTRERMVKELASFYGGVKGASAYLTTLETAHAGPTDEERAERTRVGREG